MNADVLDALLCPHCGLSLFEQDASGEVGVLTCTEGHTFDVARQGYVNLLPGGVHVGTADTAAMVAAREEFLAAGHFEPIADALAGAAATIAGDTPGLVVEIGAGTGYYLARVLDRLAGRSGLALDISKHAARRAARAHERIGAAVCDAWGRLPVASGSAAVVLDVFAPRNAAEMARVLAPGGALLVVTPTVRHLSELRAEEGSAMLDIDARKEERLATTLGAHFDAAAVDESMLEYSVAMTLSEARAAAAMGPGAHHGAGAASAAAASPVRASGMRDVTVSVRLGVYRPLLSAEV